MACRRLVDARNDLLPLGSPQDTRVRHCTTPLTDNFSQANKTGVSKKPLDKITDDEPGRGGLDVGSESRSRHLTIHTNVILFFTAFYDGAFPVSALLILI